MSRLVIVIRLPLGRATLSPYLGFSFGLHAVVVTALVFAPMMKRSSPPQDNLMVINLASDLPGPPAAKTSAPPAPAPPKPAPPPEKTEKMEAKPAEPVLTKKKKKKTTEATETKPAPAAPVTTPTPAAPTTGPAPEGAAGAGGGGITSADVGDVEFAWYRASVIAALQARWIRPILEGTAQPVSATVTFVVGRDGTVSGLRLESPSGIPSLDRSALRAVQEASPLPPLPSTWREPTLEARFRFELTPGNS